MLIESNGTQAFEMIKRVELCRSMLTFLGEGR